jgi:hypothetical protein
MRFNSVLIVPCPPSATYIGQGVDAHLRSTSAWVVNNPVISLGKLGIGSSSDEVIGVRENWSLISIHERGTVMLLISWEISIGMGCNDGSYQWWTSRVDVRAENKYKETTDVLQWSFHPAYLLLKHQQHHFSTSANYYQQILTATMQLIIVLANLLSFTSAAAIPTKLMTRQSGVCGALSTPLCCQLDVEGVANLNCENGTLTTYKELENF